MRFQYNVRIGLIVVMYLLMANVYGAKVDTLEEWLFSWPEESVAEKESISVTINQGSDSTQLKIEIIPTVKGYRFDIKCQTSVGVSTLTNNTIYNTNDKAKIASFHYLKDFGYL